jgi:hypothetical protein
MAIDFPNTPTTGQVYTSGNRSWEYDGEKWISSSFAMAETAITANTTTTVDSWSTVTYRSAKYLIQVVQGSKYTVSEVVLIHDGTTSTMAEYGIIEVGASRIPLTISADMPSSTGTILLQVTITDAATTNATVTVVPTYIAV